MKHILLVANTSYAGMGPYVASIVNSFDPEDGIRFFLVEDESKYYSKNIKNSLLPYCIFFHKKESKLKTLLNLTIKPKSYFNNELKETVRKHDITHIHSLAAFFDTEFIKWFNKRGQFIMTVHDLKKHEAKKAKHKEFRDNVLFKRTFMCFRLSEILVTNSSSQYDALKSLYPQKKIFKFPFPTLVTNVIEHGDHICPELSNEEHYILFMGRIEEYKGLKFLVDAYVSMESHRKLIIAGKGDFSGKINHPNIIYINRYIKDDEIKYLYKNAAYVVYPYISATQSGVLSLATFFKKPIIVSDLPFFRETLGESACAIYVKPGDSSSLCNAMIEIEDFNLTNMAIDSYNLYNRIYSSKNYKTFLLNLYKNL